MTGYGRIGSGLVCFGRQRKVARGSLGRLRHGRRGWFGAIWLGPVGFFPAGSVRFGVVCSGGVGCGPTWQAR